MTMMNRSEWMSYTTILLHEAAQFTGKPLMNYKPDSKTEQIRPLLFTLFPKIFNSQTVKVETNRFKNFFHNPELQSFKASLKQTEHYRLAALALQTYHAELMSKCTAQNNEWGAPDSIAFISKHLLDINAKIKAIDEKRIHQANFNLCSTVVDYIGSIFLISGCLAKVCGAKVPWMLTAAAVYSMLMLSTHIFDWLYHRHDKEQMTDEYNKIGKMAEYIRSSLLHYNDQMQVQSGIPSNYAFIYPTFKVAAAAIPAANVISSVQYKEPTSEA
jgi:hypothetical protein